MARRGWLMAGLGGAAAGCALAEPPGPAFLPLGALGGPALSSSAFALSADGKNVAGSSASPSGIQAFRWNFAEGMRGLGDFEGGFFQSRANGLSADGAVAVGSGFYGGIDQFDAFRWTAAGGLSPLGRLPGQSLSSAEGVSGSGDVVVGYAGTSAAVEAFRWTAVDGMQMLGDLPGGAFDSRCEAVSADGAVSVGWSHSSAGPQAFRWTPDVGMVGLGDLPGGDFLSQAYDVSADGGLVVGHSWSDAGLAAFRWSPDSGMTALPLPADAAGSSSASATSADGSVIVGTYDRMGELGIESSAFIWDATHGARNLEAVLTAAGVDLTGWDLLSAMGVSADGRTIAGTVQDAALQQQAFVARIPEPATFWFLFGAAALRVRNRFGGQIAVRRWK